MTSPGGVWFVLIVLGFLGVSCLGLWFGVWQEFGEIPSLFFFFFVITVSIHLNVSFRCVCRVVRHLYTLLSDTQVSQLPT